MRRKHILIICLAIIACNALSGCWMYWNRYNNKEHKFSVMLPRFWRMSEGGKALVFILQSPLRGKADRFQENINIVSKVLPQQLDFETFFDVNQDHTLRTVPGAKLDVSVEEIYAGRVRGKYLMFTSKSAQFSVRVISGVWMKGNHVVLITCTGNEKDFYRYEDTFKKVMQSLRIKD